MKIHPADNSLSRTSATSQRHVLAFEPLSMENWRNLGVILQQGQRALIREQAPRQNRKSVYDDTHQHQLAIY